MALGLRRLGWRWACTFHVVYVNFICVGHPTQARFPVEYGLKETQLVRPTELCGKVLSEKNGYKSVKTALLLSNVIDADHQNTCLFANKGHILSPLWGFIGVVAKFHE